MNVRNEDKADIMTTPFDPTNRDVVTIDYTNWRGERRVRRVQPLQLLFGDNEWHTTPQWLLAAYCFESNDCRYFAMSGIHSWKSATQ